WRFNEQAFLGQKKIAFLGEIFNKSQLFNASEVLEREGIRRNVNFKRRQCGPRDSFLITSVGTKYKA
ncbi:Hypothetical protein FKW44_011361, partial [Caligus rogercresseyi]